MTRATIAEQLELAKRGEHSRLVCRVTSGWLFLGRYQFLPGYCVLAADPPVKGLNALTGEARARFLADMGRVGDTLLKTTDAVRINYAILGNGDPALHAHLQPRYADEKEPYRSGPVDLIRRHGSRRSRSTWNATNRLCGNFAENSSRQGFEHVKTRPAGLCRF